MQLKPPYTRHAIEQATRVAELLDAGYSLAGVAKELGVSRPRISQIRRTLPHLQASLGDHTPTARLRRHRAHLVALRNEALALAGAIRRDLREVNEELQSAEVDAILGLRRIA
jgi:transposase-like protein